ncbi:MAG: hypothetical protein ACFFHD_10230 [Promethearchaeota archaeon]
MTVNLELKKEFLTNFQNKIITARKLLFASNHQWAGKILDNLIMEIEKNEWIDAQKKHQLTMIISNSWWIYINSLVKREEGEVKIDLIKYIDAYKRFFSFLSKLEDMYLFDNFSFNLLRQFIKMENISQIGITKFFNSISAKLLERDEGQKLIEMQILLMFLRKSVIPSEYFNSGLKKFGRTIFNLEPAKRSLFIYIILESVCIKYELMEDSAEFVRIINKILINRLPGYLKNEFSNVSRISINKRSFDTILVDLEDLIYYLNNIGEYSWIIIMIKNIFSKIQEYNSFGEAVTYIRRFINFAIKRNRFEMAFEIYDFLEDLFILQSDLSYDKILIELWVEASKNFVDMKEKKYLLQSLEKLNNHLKFPQTKSEIFHYFYTCNILWQFKSLFFSLEQRDFWRMMFYRALFEEKNFNITQKIIPYLDKDFENFLTDIVSLYNEIEPIKSEIYSFNNWEDTKKPDKDGFLSKQLVITINSKGMISYRMISIDNRVIEGVIINEFWNDAQLLEIYSELFYDPEKRKYNFNLIEFGQLFFLFLPKEIRDFFKSLKIEKMNVIPQIYFILDNMIIPYDLIYDNNFFLLKYASGYKIGEIPLGGIVFEDKNSKEYTLESINNLFEVLIIDTINSKGPLKWNDNTKQKEILFPFPAGVNELNYILNFFNDRTEIKHFKPLIGPNSTRENILSSLSSGTYHIIIFVGNILYSKLSPKDSYFITNDNEIITFTEINNTLNNSKTQPFLFFDGQVFDSEGKRVNNTLKIFGEIVSQFNHDRITGIIGRSYPLFNDETKQILSIFFKNLLNNNSQGVSLLKARQEYVSQKIEKIIEQQVKESDMTERVKRIGVRNILALSSYLLFGQPWKKLKF